MQAEAFKRRWLWRKNTTVTYACHFITIFKASLTIFTIWCESSPFWTDRTIQSDRCIPHQGFALNHSKSFEMPNLLHATRFDCYNCMCPPRCPPTYEGKVFFFLTTHWEEWLCIPLCIHSSKYSHFVIFLHHTPHNILSDHTSHKPTTLMFYVTLTMHNTISNFNHAFWIDWWEFNFRSSR